MAQKKEMGEAQETTNFKIVAHVALEENGQCLEKLRLGVVP